MKAFLRSKIHSLCRLLHNTLYNKRLRRRTLRAERRLRMATKIYGEESPIIDISVEMQSCDSSEGITGAGNAQEEGVKDDGNKNQ